MSDLTNQQLYRKLEQLVAGTSKAYVENLVTRLFNALAAQHTTITDKLDVIEDKIDALEGGRMLVAPAESLKDGQDRDSH